MNLHIGGEFQAGQAHVDVLPQTGPHHLKRELLLYEGKTHNTA
jgi:hypothetical protein